MNFGVNIKKSKIPMFTAHKSEKPIIKLLDDTFRLDLFPTGTSQADTLASSSREADINEKIAFNVMVSSERTAVKGGFKEEAKSIDTVSRIENFNKVRKMTSQVIENGALPKRGHKDFIFMRTIGEGSYAAVYRAREVQSSAEFAVKVIEKAFLRRMKKTESIIRENNILKYLTLTCKGSPFVTPLYTSFQDRSRIYFVMPVAEKRDLASTLSYYGSFNIPITQFFGSEILAGAEFLHSKNILHRDLKPENILIKDDGHIMIADFGSACAYNGFKLEDVSIDAEDSDDSKSTDSSESPQQRRVERQDDEWSDDEERSKERRSTFVGTAQYVSPEMLRDHDVGPGADLWAFGCIIYQCLAGQAPFRGMNPYHMIKKIEKLDFVFPEGFDPIAKELISGILILDPTKRLTTEQIKNHKFFEPINWADILATSAPQIHAYLPASSNEPEFYSDDLEPGFDENTIHRIRNIKPVPVNSVATFVFDDDLDTPADLVSKVQANSASAIREARLAEQRKSNPYHFFTQNNLILRSGFLDKKRGLFSRKRMFLLTEGPHLFYVDPSNMQLKGEIPWSPCMRTEIKNFSIFFIHTPNRVYYLSDPEHNAVNWCDAINKLKNRYDHHIARTYEIAMREGTFHTMYGKKKSRKEIMREERSKHFVAPV